MMMNSHILPSLSLMLVVIASLIAASKRRGGLAISVRQGVIVFAAVLAMHAVVIGGLLAFHHLKPT